MKANDNALNRMVKEMLDQANKNAASRAVDFFKNLDKTTIKKTKVQRKQSDITLSFDNLKEGVTFVLNKEKKLKEIKIRGQKDVYEVKLNKLDEAFQVFFNNTLKEYVAHFNLKIRLLLIS